MLAVHERLAKTMQAASLLVVFKEITSVPNTLVLPKHNDDWVLAHEHYRWLLNDNFWLLTDVYVSIAHQCKADLSGGICVQ